MPGWPIDPMSRPGREAPPEMSYTSTTLNAFLRYVTASTPLPKVTPSMTASWRSGTTSRQFARAGFAALTATTRPLGAPFVVCRNSTSSITAPNACPASPVVTGHAIDRAGLPEQRRSSPATGRSIACRPSSRAAASGRRAKGSKRGPTSSPAVSFSSFVNWRNSSGIVGRRRAKTVEAHLTGVRILRVLEILVHEAGSVGQPVGRLGLVRNLERPRFARIDFHQVQRRVLVTRAVRAVGDEIAVARRRRPLDRRQSRGVDLRRIDQDAIVAAVALPASR